MRAIPSAKFQPAPLQPAPFQPASYPVRAAARMEPVRILGYSSAIAINTLAAGLLLMPLQAPLPVPAPEPQAVWILPATPPPPPLPPPPADLPRPTTPAPRVAPVAISPTPPVVAPVLVDQGTLPALPPMVDPAPLASIEPGPAMAGPSPVTLQYAVAPPPPYPRGSARNGDEGLVMLQVLVDIDGRPLQVEIAQGSGHRELDRAARRHVLAHWRFQPAMRDGHAVQAIGLVPIDFSLR